MADSILFIGFVNHIFIAHQAYGYHVHTTLEKLVFTDLDGTVPDDIHSEYYFGECRKHGKVLRFKDVKTYDDIKGKIMIRGDFRRQLAVNTTFVGVPELPDCVYVRARSKYTDIVRYHAFKFSICICNIIVQHTNQIFNFPHYEWLLPVEQKEGIIWELYFYK